MGVGDKVKEVTSSAKRRVGVEAPLAADEKGKIGTVRGALRAFGEGDMDAFVDALKNDVVWESPEGENFPGAGEHNGPDEVRTQFIGDAGRTYTSFGFQPDSFMETDKEDAVIVVGRFVGEGVEGENLDTPGVQIWGFTGSEVTHVRIFADSAAFPEVVTEEKEKEWAEEDKKEEEDDDDGEKSESDDKSKSESKDESDDDDDEDDDSGDKTESKSDDKAESKSEDKTDSGDKSESDDDEESKNGKPALAKAGEGYDEDDKAGDSSDSDDDDK